MLAFFKKGGANNQTNDFATGKIQVLLFCSDVVPSPRPKIKHFFGGLYFYQSAGLVCNRRQAHVIRLLCKRYATRSQDLCVFPLV